MAYRTFLETSAFADAGLGLYKTSFRPDRKLAAQMLPARTGPYGNEIDTTITRVYDGL